VNVLHVIPSVSTKHGGPTVAIKAITSALSDRGVKVTVATSDDDGSSSRLNVLLETPVEEGDVTYLYFKRDLVPYKVSLGLAKWLHANASRFDLIHIHALFQFASTAAARIAYTRKVPYVVRPLGVLNRWGMQNRRRVAKLISFPLVELPILRGSAAIHYTSQTERDQANLLHPSLTRHRSAVIPLPVGAPAAPRVIGDQLIVNGIKEKFVKQFPQSRGKRIVLFLSRIDRMKGLDLLLDSFEIVQEEYKDVMLVIAGAGDEVYVRELQSRPSARKNAANTVWAGYLNVADKSAAFAAADVSVLPSSSENFGIAAAESLAAGVPTIVSEEVALSSDILQYNAGFVVKRDKQEIGKAICRLLSSKEESAALAANGVRLVRERYSPDAVGRALHTLYEELTSDRAGASSPI
jgi:glycosyltransferase involved in cell wall biosynthesis